MFSHLSLEGTKISQKIFEQEKGTFTPRGLFKAKCWECSQPKEMKLILKALAKVYFGSSIEHLCGDKSSC